VCTCRQGTDFPWHLRFCPSFISAIYAFSPSVCVTSRELFQSAFSAIPLFVFVFSVKENRRHTGDAEMSSDDESKENQYRFGTMGCNKTKRTEMNDIFIFTYPKM